MEQVVDSVPVVPHLHTVVPQMVDSVVEVLKILDNSPPDVEQVIEVLKINLHTAPQRSSLLLVFEFINFRRAEGALGIAVCRAAGHTWIMRVRDTGWRDKAQGGFQILGKGDDVDVSVTMHDKFQQSLPIYSEKCLSSVHRQSGGHCRYATETGTHSMSRSLTPRQQHYYEGSYAMVAVSSPLSSRSGRRLARSGSSAEDVVEIVKSHVVYEFFGSAGGAAAGAELLKGGTGRAAFRRPWRFFRCRSLKFFRFSSSTECAPLRVNRDRYPQELQFLDKVVDELVLCNDWCSNFLRFLRDA